MDELTFIGEPKIEEVPCFFKFEKQHFTSQHPDFASLNYDPFPDKNNNEIVRTEIIARELVLRAKLKGPPDSLKMGMAVNFDGKKFALQKINMQLSDTTEECLFDIVGTASVSGEEPLAVLKRLRSSLAASNK